MTSSHPQELSRCFIYVNQQKACADPHPLHTRAENLNPLSDPPHFTLVDFFPIRTSGDHIKASVKTVFLTCTFHLPREPQGNDLLSIYLVVYWSTCYVFECRSKNVKLFFSIFLLRSKGASLYSMEKWADLMTTKRFGIFRERKRKPPVYISPQRSSP